MEGDNDKKSVRNIKLWLDDKINHDINYESFLTNIWDGDENLDTETTD